MSDPSRQEDDKCREVAFRPKRSNLSLAALASKASMLHHSDPAFRPEAADDTAPTGTPDGNKVEGNTSQGVASIEFRQRTRKISFHVLAEKLEKEGSWRSTSSLGPSQSAGEGTLSKISERHVHTPKGDTLETDHRDVQPTSRDPKISPLEGIGLPSHDSSAEFALHNDDSNAMDGAVPATDREHGVPLERATSGSDWYQPRYSSQMLPSIPKLDSEEIRQTSMYDSSEMKKSSGHVLSLLAKQLRQRPKKTSIFDKGPAAAAALALVLALLGQVVLEAIVNPSETIFMVNPSNPASLGACQHLYNSDGEIMLTDGDAGTCPTWRLLYVVMCSFSLIFNLLALLCTVAVAIGITSWLQYAYVLFVL